ncbi:hypothetical protein pb186bvf_007837 [Paramecium bursaria]
MRYRFREKNEIKSNQPLLYKKILQFRLYSFVYDSIYQYTQFIYFFNSTKALYQRINCLNEKSIKMFLKSLKRKILPYYSKNISIVLPKMNSGPNIDQYLKIKKQKVFWNEIEDQNLHQLVKQFGRNWNKISEILITRSPTQCSQRWKKIKPERVRAQAWSQQEDGLIKKLISKHGQKWTVLANVMKTRTPQQIRDRYTNILDPQILQAPFSNQEDEQILELYYQMGPKWSTISKNLIGRSPNCIKNRFNTYLKRVYFSQPQLDVLPSDCTTQFMCEESIQYGINLKNEQFYRETFEENDKNEYQHNLYFQEDNLDYNSGLFQ